MPKAQPVAMKAPAKKLEIKEESFPSFSGSSVPKQMPKTQKEEKKKIMDSDEESF